MRSRVHFSHHTPAHPRVMSRHNSRSIIHSRSDYHTHTKPGTPVRSDGDTTIAPVLEDTEDKWYILYHTVYSSLYFYPSDSAFELTRGIWPQTTTTMNSPRVCRFVHYFSLTHCISLYRRDEGRNRIQSDPQPDSQVQEAPTDPGRRPSWISSQSCGCGMCCAYTRDTHVSGSRPKPCHI
jgi:hypothetical protein